MIITESDSPVPARQSSRCLADRRVTQVFGFTNNVFLIQINEATPYSVQNFNRYITKKE
jgi:hypothetical protein